MATITLPVDGSGLSNPSHPGRGRRRPAGHIGDAGIDIGGQS
jgi:hypothetical protein